MFGGSARMSGAAIDSAPACTRLRGWTRSRCRGLPDGSVRVKKVGEWSSVGGPGGPRPVGVFWGDFPLPFPTGNID
jgi:hypothetical protein